MALTLKNSPTAAGATAPTKQEAKQEVMKAEAEAVVKAPSYDESIFYSKSGSVAFVAPLGDPSHPDVTTDKEGKKSVTPYIVGYRFKALEDMVVPHCGLGEDARKNLMSFIDKNATLAVKAGQEFDMTRFDTGLLLATPEFNGKITGEGKTFTAVYQSNSLKTKKGELGSVSSATEIPTVSLKAESGSIKDYAIIEVLDFVDDINPVNNVKRKLRTCKPGMEYFENLCKVQTTRTRSAGSASSTKIERNKKAEAFLQIVAKK